MSDRPQSAPVTLGFITVLQEPTGWVGGYLVTNAWGRPLEFRLTTAVQPNRIQAALYGPTLTEYLHADIIGKALVEKTTVKPDLIITDNPAMVTLHSRIAIPVIGFGGDISSRPSETHLLTHPRSPLGLILPDRGGVDDAAIISLIEAIDPAVELAEPFTRIREAIAEARKMGVSARAA